jgi:hypothetical protein
MSESEWLECVWPGDMIGFLPPQRNDRKLRLFGCASIRRIWGLLADDRSRQVIEVAERYADSLVGRRALEAARIAAGRAHETLFLGEVSQLTASSRAHAVAAASRAAAHLGERNLPAAFEAATWAAAAVGHAAAAARWGEDGGVEWAAHDHFDRDAHSLELGVQCVLLRDLFGNPFRPVAVDPAWRTRTVTTLAQAAYEGRILPVGEMDPALLGVLADAVEEAGCTDGSILEHLRDHGPHIRGCWVVDRLLLRERQP